MKIARSALVVLAVLVLSISFAFPAEDLIATPYDESDGLPYESTPLFSGMQQQAAQLPYSAMRLESQVQARRRAACRMRAKRSEHMLHSVCDLVILLDHSLRC